MGPDSISPKLDLRLIEKQNSYHPNTGDPTRIYWMWKVIDHVKHDELGVIEYSHLNAGDREIKIKGHFTPSQTIYLMENVIEIIK